MSKRNRLHSAAVLGVLTLALSACGDAGGSKSNSSDAPTLQTGKTDATDVCDESRIGGTLNYRMLPEGSGLDPAVAQSNMTAGAAIFGTLIRWNNDEQTFEGDVAESITGNEDSTEWTLKLRDDVTYSDGKPLDAEAVKANLERYLDPAFASSFTARVAEIKSMTVQDPQTLVLTLNSSWGTFPWLLTQSPGMIVNPAVLATAKPETLAGQLPENAGAGAFTFESYKRGQSITVQSKKDWWGGPVCLDELTLTFSTGDGSADYDAFKAGQITGFFAAGDILPQLDKDDSLELYELPEAIGSPVLMNTTKPPFDDVRMRQAVSYALNRELIEDRIYKGFASGTASLVPPSFPVQPQTKGLEYDEQKAADLISALKADGKKTDFSYLVASNPSNENLAILQQAMLKQAGIGMNNELLQIPDWIERVFTSRNFDAAMGGITVPSACAYCGLDQFGSNSTSNTSGFKSATLDAALAQLKAARPGDETAAALDGLQKVWNEEMPSPISHWVPNYVALDANVKGLVFSSSAYQVHFDKAYIAH